MSYLYILSGVLCYGYRWCIGDTSTEFSERGCKMYLSHHSLGLYSYILILKEQTSLTLRDACVMRNWMSLKKLKFLFEISKLNVFFFQDLGFAYLVFLIQKYWITNKQLMSYQVNISVSACVCGT